MISLIKSILFCLLLYSCSSLDVSYFNMTSELIKKSKIELSSTELDKIPYSFAKISYNGNEAIYILSSIKNGFYSWVGSDLSKITTYNGLIVNTVGFGSEHTLVFPSNQFFKLGDDFSYELSINDPRLIRYPVIYNVKKTRVNNNKNCKEYFYTKVTKDLNFKDDVFCIEGDKVIYSKQYVSSIEPYIEMEITYKY